MENKSSSFVQFKNEFFSLELRITWFLSILTGHWTPPPQVLCDNGRSRPALRVQLERVAGDSEAHRTGGDVHVPDTDAVGGGSRQCAVHKWDTDPSYYEWDSRVLPSAGGENRHSPADVEHDGVESVGYWIVVVLSVAEAVQVPPVEGMGVCERGFIYYFYSWS